MSAVKAAPLDPVALAARFEAAGLSAGFHIEHFGMVANCPLLALTKHTPGPRPRIYLSSGVHGDEPAAPLVLLEMLEAGVFDAQAVWFLCPLLNPDGLARGTRANAGGVDLNRDYKDLQSAETRAHVSWLRRQPNFDLTFCLHEDWESTGYYLYELNPFQRTSLAATAIKAAADVCPIDQSAQIDGRATVEPGIIRPVNDPLLRETWPEAIYLRANHTTLSYTVETPSGLPLAQRIAAHRAALEAALKLAIHDWHKTPAGPPAETR